MSFIDVFRLKLINKIISGLGKSGQKLAEKLQQESDEAIPQIDIPQQSAQPVSFHADEEGFLYLDNIQKISENLNDMNWGFDMYIDTTKLAPGIVIYVISSQPPTPQRPWTVYKYEPRVITSIHDSGVNGGTVFFTYSHSFVQQLSFSKSKDNDGFQVVSNEDSIYSPLTKGHAQFICAELNSQSRSLYQSHLEKMKQNIK